MINEIKLWIAHVGESPTSIWVKLADVNQDVCRPLREFCHKEGIELTKDIPLVYHRNPKMDTVKTLKRVLKINEEKAQTCAELKALCYAYTGQELNCTLRVNENNEMRTPNSEWPEAPHLHEQQELPPWACLVHGFVGKRSEDPNSAPRGSPGIYVGHNNSA